MAESRKRPWVLYAVLSGIGVGLLGCCSVGMVLAWALGLFQRLDEDKFLKNARKSDRRVARMYEVYPESVAQFNKGDRRGRRGAFGDVYWTFTLMVPLESGHILYLYRGIAVDGITTVSSHDSYYVNQSSDIDGRDFDLILDAQRDPVKIQAAVKTAMANRPDRKVIFPKPAPTAR